MPRKATKKKSELSLAVVALRKALGQSQQAFSNKLGLALNTIARYETSNPPSGRVLFRLRNLAHELGLSDVADIFESALIDEASESPALESYLKDQVDYASRQLRDVQDKSIQQLMMMVKFAERAMTGVLAHSEFSRDLEIQLAQLRKECQGLTDASGTSLDTSSRAASLERAHDLATQLFAIIERAQIGLLRGIADAGHDN